MLFTVFAYSSKGKPVRKALGKSYLEMSVTDYCYTNDNKVRLKFVDIFSSLYD